LQPLLGLEAATISSLIGLLSLIANFGMVGKAIAPSMEVPMRQIQGHPGWHSLLLGSSAISLIMLSGSAFAQETVPTSPIEQQLQTGCLAGTSANQFEGDRAVTRYEFAAGLNACLQQIEAQLAQPKFVTRSDLEAAIQQQEDLNQQLRELNSRLDAIAGDEEPSTQP